ncbi:MAG TPA: type II toxin-antitoxin system VapC family toxin [Candidatus Baltobacteraceae bacterium]|nr:type II toxin-antitoxin system VapC family toxin [Candidatus Baltobacteraceae bacterium]
MIAIDTNVLVRLIAKDDSKQLALAKAYLTKHCAPDTPALVNRVVLAEVAWVLQSLYEYSREQIAIAVTGLLATATFTVEDAPEVRAALEHYRKGGIDFSDALIATTNRRSGASCTATFDRPASKKLPEFTLIE